jgi:NAD(P)-dependent dehydrogenase (short-subunit alcohol dehydrogenase family)
MKRVGWRGEDWRVVVTGASSGIGRAAAERLAAAGARVALWARRGDELASLARELGEGAVAVPCDVADPAAVAEAARRSEASIGLVNGLINAAGVADPRPLARLDPEAWRRTIAVNLSGSFHTCHAIATRLRQDGAGGSIVNIGSELSAMGAPSYSAYCASKFGVVGLTKALAAELAPEIRVNVLCPGPVDTPMLDGEFALADDPGKARVDENQRPPMKRLGQPGEMGDAAVWLLTRPGFATGAVLPIDGGTTAV